MILFLKMYLQSGVKVHLFVPLQEEQKDEDSSLLKMKNRSEKDLYIF